MQRIPDRYPPGARPAGDALRRLALRGIPLGLACLLLTAVPVLATVPEILPLDQVRPGMKGVGRTVFQGDRIEEFPVEIVAVLKNARPQGSVILFRGAGPVLDHAGIIAGMSGSPVYVDGKLVGAVAFAYPMSKDPIGGITPIEEMLDLLKLKEGDDGAGAAAPSSPDAGKASAGRSGPDGQGAAGEAAVDGTGDSGQFQRLWSAFLRRDDPAAAPGPTEEATEESDEGAAGLQELAVPVSLAGWDPSLQPAMSRALRGLGFMAASAGGGTVVAAVPRQARPGTSGMPLEPGAAVGIPLVQGDATIAAIGTLTYNDGQHLLAFGHPMIQGGAVSFPLTAAWIHTVMPNLEVSYKIGTATEAVGRIWEDRRSGVLGTVGETADMIPVRVRVEEAGGAPRMFHYRVIRNPMFTPTFLSWAVTNSFLAAGWSQGDAAGRTTVTVHYDGDQAVIRRDRFTTDAPGPHFGADLTLPAALLLTNPFERARLDSLSIDVAYERKDAHANITQVTADRPWVEVGDSLRLAITLEPYREKPEVRMVSFRVPAAWAGERIQFTAAGAAEMMQWDHDRAPSKYLVRSLRQLEQFIQEIPSDGSVIVRALSGSPGSLVAGLDMPGLPPSLASAGQNGAGRGIVSQATGSVLEERALETPWVVSGRESTIVEVLP